MKFLSTWLLAAAFGFGVSAGSASATTIVDEISGSFGSGVGAFTGEITLDVVGGQVVAGSGTIDILGLTNAPLSLITTSTPGNETAGGPNTVGFRANDGTDLFGLDTAYPIDSDGLLFDVGVSSPVSGAFPLINLASGAGASVFDGKVGGTEYYVAFGTTTFTAAPEASTWAMVLIGLASLGFAGYRGRARAAA